MPARYFKVTSPNMRLVGGYTVPAGGALPDH
jgi:hypothetical protein